MSDADGIETGAEDVRSMPWNGEAEMSVLGAMMQGGAEVVMEASDLVRGDDFYGAGHGEIFGVLMGMADAGTPVDLVTVMEGLEKAGVAEKVGGASRVTEIFGFVAGAAHLRDWARMVVEMRQRRLVIRAGVEMQRGAYDMAVTAASVMEGAETVLFALRRDEASAVRKLSVFVSDAMEDLEGVMSGRGGVTMGLETGFVDVDRTMMGMKPGSMIVVGARPSMGKSAFGFQVAEHVAFNQGGAVLAFSLEMSGRSLATRMLLGRSDVALLRMRDGFLSKAEQARLAVEADTMCAGRFYLDETPAISIRQIRARARMTASRFGLDFVVVDYLQLVTSPSKRSEMSRQIEVAEVSAGLKALAMELNVPVMVLAQVNRNADDRKEGMPRLSDLRESGSLEQDADVVLFITRPGKHFKEAEDDTGVFEIAKQRNGPVGRWEVEWMGPRARFGDLKDEQGRTRKLYGTEKAVTEQEQGDEEW